MAMLLVLGTILLKTLWNLSSPSFLPSPKCGEEAKTDYLSKKVKELMSTIMSRGSTAQEIVVQKFLDIFGNTSQSIT